MLPNFLIIGAMKAGTTSLYHYLDQHPQIFMGENKEPNYFINLGVRRGVTGGKLWNPPAPWDVHELDDYERLFEPGRDYPARGEASVGYLHSPWAAALIKEQIPDCKIIAVLRDPVNRAISSHSFMTHRAEIETEELEKSLREDAERVARNEPLVMCHVKLGYYHEQLTPYYEAFDESQIHVMLTEDLRSEKKMREVFRFLGVDEDFHPDTTATHNPGAPRSKLVADVMHGENPIRSLARMVVPKQYRKGIYQRISRANKKKDTISDDLRRALIEDYREDILALQEKIGRDLSAWLR